jgi:toxin ParE1/3/4
MTPRSHRVIVQGLAEADIAGVARFYEEQRPGLGRDFLAEIEAAIVRAAENPFQFPCRLYKPEVRRVLTERFPYRIFYIVHEQDIVVFRVLHGARHDREWKSNIPKG